MYNTCGTPHLLALVQSRTTRSRRRARAFFLIVCFIFFFFLLERERERERERAKKIAHIKVYIHVFDTDKTAYKPKKMREGKRHTEKRERDTENSITRWISSSWALASAVLVCSC